jgi:protein-tyrosine phosphatase
MKRIDFHSHILPNVDDGAATIAESLSLLRTLKNDGVETVVATPHLYLHRESVSSFFAKRDEGAFELSQVIKAEEQKGISYPKIVLGAEVYFTQGLGNLPLKDLCIEGTDYLMLELPYSSFTTTFLNSLANFIYSCDVKIILAHIERYFDFSEPKMVTQVLNHGLISQVNCDSVISARTRRMTLKLIESGDIKLLGTDLHSIEMRPPRFAEAEHIIRKKLSDGTFENMMETAAKILSGKDDEE